MFATTRSARLLLHLANLLAIFFILLPVVATAIGALQSEKSLQADTRRVLPPEYTLDNFALILSGGAQKGRIFEQATYLPENVKHFYAAFSNSVIVSLSVTLLTLLFAPMSAYTIARPRSRRTPLLLQPHLAPRLVPVITRRIP